MRTFETLNTPYRWLAGHLRPRDTVGAAALAVMMVATALDAPVDRPRPMTTAHLASDPSCERIATIDQPEAVPGKDWQRVAIEPRVDCFRMTPTSVDTEGVFPTTAFTFRAAGAISVKQVADRLTSTPRVGLEITPTDEARTFRVKPTSPLREGAIYRFQLAAKEGSDPAARWAFQVSSRLRVTQTLPANEATRVPTDLGIEFVFTHDDVRGVAERFSIEPHVDGRFETHDRVVVFVPDELKPRTLYKVKLDAGVTAPGAEEPMAKSHSFAFETGAGKRKSGIRSIGGFGRQMWESPTTRSPSVGYYGEPRDGKLTISVYRYPNAARFLEALKKRAAVPSWAEATARRLKHPTGPLDRVSRFEARVRQVGEYDSFIEFPERMPAGLYLVQATRQGWSRAQTLLQVTDVAAHVTISRTRSVVWSHDLRTKKPLSGATVSVDDEVVGTPTNPDGIADFRNPKGMLRLSDADLGEQIQARAAAFVVRAPDGRICVVALREAMQGDYSYEYRQNSFPGNPDLYWRYIYTDRHVYRLNDSVRFWGLVRARGAAKDDDQPVTIEITGWDDASERNVTIAKRSVRRSERGTFIGSLSFRDAPPGWYQLEARVGSDSVASTSIEIQDFVTPAYRMDVSSTRRVLLSGQDAVYNASASFFDGTPVPGLAINATFNGRGERITRTDSKGEVRITRPVVADGTEDVDTIQLAPARPEEAEISTGTSVRVLPSRVTLSSSGKVVGDKGVVAGSVRRFDFEAANASDAEPYGDFDAGPVPGTTVRASVIGTWYRRIDEGVGYDFIAKRTYKRYRYESVEENVGTYTATTDGRGAYRLTFPADDKFDFFSAALKARDDGGRVVEEDVYLSRPSGFDRNDYWSRYSHLEEMTEGPYAIGEQVRLTMRTDRSTVVAKDVEQYVFIAAMNGIRSVTPTSSATIRFPFGASDVPGISTSAVRFTGYSYVHASGPVLAFDTASKALTVEVNPRQRRYRPGEKATLDVRVTDRSGRPVPEAEVLLGAVDEALYHLQGEGFYEDIQILDALYDIPSSGIYGFYSTHVTPGQPGGPESGGEGPAREDFRDVALFDRVTTNGSGRASVTFTVPDNLTSWRVTALAVTNDLQAGRSVSLVPVGLPLFVQPSLNETYLVSDRPSIRLRAFGTALSRSDDVTYTVRARSLGPTMHATGKAFEPVDVDLPPLELGAHRIAIRVRAGERSDAIVRTIKVVSSRLQRLDLTFDELGPGDRLAVQDSLEDQPVTVVLADHNRGRYLSELLGLTWDRGDRLDQILPRVLAQGLLNEHFERGPSIPRERFRGSMYQKPDGGLAIFPFAGEDLLMSARIAANAPDRFDTRSLDAFFRRVYNDDEENLERKIVALYGRAALGSAVLLKVQLIMRRTDLSILDRLRLGLAAAHLGDETSARTLYDDVLEEVGEVRGSMIRLKSGGDRDDWLEATALAAILGARIRDDHSPMLFAFVVSTGSDEILTALDRVEFLSVALPAMSGEPVRFSTVEGGERVERTLGEGRSYALRVRPTEMDALDLRVIDGRIGTSVYAIVALEPARVEPEPGLSIVRSIEGETGPVALEEDQIVRIDLDYTLPPDADEACYQVDDLLPAGLALVSDLHGWPGEEEDTADYPFAVRDQRVSFCHYDEVGYDRLTYYARVTGTGTFTAEPATIQSLQTTESLAVGKAATVTIG